MSNEFVKIVDAVGHGFEVVFDDGKTIAEKLPQYIDVTEDAVEDAPTIVKDVTGVVTALSGGAAVFDALVIAIEGFGTNAAADVAAVQAIATDAPKIGSYWSGVKSSIETLLTTLGADEKQIAAIFAPATAAAPAPVVS